MTKYELSLTRDYVPGWTIVDAMRELFQNALDQETTQPDNKMFWEYHEDIESFHIGNKLSVLEPKTLLLGGGTKANDPNTIGKFGEGYKIATLVLTRLGKKVKFFNYGAREVWTARFSKSKKYGAEILVFEIDKAFPWKAVPNNNLTIVVEGVTSDEALEVRDTNLHTQTHYDSWESPKGSVLIDKDLKGKMFVNGLYICKSDIFEYGYDFKPQYVKLDRDRKLIPDFNLKWTTAQIWTEFQDGNDNWDYDAIDAASRMVSEGKPDVEYLIQANEFKGPTKLEAIVENVYESFKIDHGENAVPVTTNEELASIPATHKAVLVNDTFKKVIRSSPDYVEPAPEAKPSYSQRLREWYDEYSTHVVDDEAYEKLEVLLIEMEENDI